MCRQTLVLDVDSAVPKMSGMDGVGKQGRHQAQGRALGRDEGRGRRTRAARAGSSWTGDGTGGSSREKERTRIVSKQADLVVAQSLRGKATKQRDETGKKGPSGPTESRGSEGERVATSSWCARHRRGPKGIFWAVNEPGPGLAARARAPARHAPSVRRVCPGLRDRREKGTPDGQKGRRTSRRDEQRRASNLKGKRARLTGIEGVSSSRALFGGCLVPSWPSWSRRAKAAREDGDDGGQTEGGEGEGKPSWSLAANLKSPKGPFVERSVNNRCSVLDARFQNPTPRTSTS